MPKFVVGLDMQEFDILREYMSTLKPNLEMIEESIIYGILSQLVTDYIGILIPTTPTMGKNEASKLGAALVSEEDMFIYKCSVGSAKKTLECFQFKFIAEEVDELKKVGQWITDIR